MPTKVEEYVAARLALVVARGSDEGGHKEKANRLWAAMTPEERREAEVGYHAAVLAESRSRK